MILTIFLKTLVRQDRTFFLVFSRLFPFLDEWARSGAEPLLFFVVLTSYSKSTRPTTLHWLAPPIEPSTNGSGLAPPKEPSAPPLYTSLLEVRLFGRPSLQCRSARSHLDALYLVPDCSATSAHSMRPRTNK